jgi:hypothetical protein
VKGDLALHAGCAERRRQGPDEFIPGVAGMCRTPDSRLNSYERERSGRKAALPQNFEESDAGCHGDVERTHTTAHGNREQHIAVPPDIGTQAAAFAAGDQYQGAAQVGAKQVLITFPGQPVNPRIPPV